MNVEENDETQWTDNSFSPLGKSVPTSSSCTYYLSRDLVAVKQACSTRLS